MNTPTSPSHDDAPIVAPAAENDALATWFAGSRDAIAVVDGQHCYVYVNAAGAALLHDRPEHMRGRDYLSTIHPDDREAVRAILAAGLAGTTQSWTATAVGPDGRARRVAVTTLHLSCGDDSRVVLLMRPAPDADFGANGGSREVDHAAEAQLRERNEQYHRIFEATSDGLIINDPVRGVVVEANAAVCAMHGYSHGEFIGLHATAFIHPDFHSVFEDFRRTIMAGGTYETQAVDLRKDGTPFHVEVHGSSVLYQGRPHILAVVRDVTERVQAREVLEQHVAERTRELSTLLELSSHVASTLELQPLLRLILDRLKTVVENSGAAIHVVQGDWLEMLEHRFPPGNAPGPTRRPLADSRFWQERLRHGRPVIIDDLLDDSYEAAIYRDLLGDDLEAALPYVRSYIAVPLILKGHAIGVLVTGHPEPGYFTPNRQALLMAVGNQAAVAIENARLYAKAQNMAALEERQRLARELHDSVSQALYAIALGARTARTQLDRDPARAAEPLDYVLTLAGAALSEMRALIFELRPESLDAEGLVAALERQVTALRARHDLTIQATLGPEPEVPFAIKEALYRIAREALHNTVKHSAASEIDIRLEAGTTWLALTVSDNGRGFDPHGSFPGHLGLQTMRERATRLGGTLDVESVTEQGTRVRVVIPLDAAPATQ